MVIGDPGAGKSSLLRMILANSLEICENEPHLRSSKLPIYIELRRYAEYISQNGYATILDYFFDLLKINKKCQIKIRRDCYGCKALFLLDALDEVPKDMIITVSEQILESSHQYSESTFIVSSRVGDRNRLKGFTIYEISDFSSDNRGEFIRKWFSLIDEPELSEKLIESIDLTNSIKEITTNPLLLSLICILFKNDRDLPNRRAEVFERCIQILIREWDTERDFRRRSQFSTLSDEKRIHILSEIASYYLKQSRRYFTEDDLARFLDHLQDEFEITDTDPRDMIKEICSHYGIIVPAGYANYGFSHLSFQEYLTARYTVKQNNFDSLLVDYSENKRWLETLLFAAGRIGSFRMIFDDIKSNTDLTDADKFHLIYLIIRRTNVTIEIDYRNDLFEYVTS